MSEAPKKTLARKLSEVMAAVSHVPKNGRHPTQNYPFATDVDVMAAVRMKLAEMKIVLTHRAESVEWRTSKTETPIAVVKVAFTAHDGESGESMEVASAYGEGMDSQDKCVPKAITSATKYALLKLFLMPTGDDPEAHDADAVSEPSPRIPTPARAAPARQQQPAGDGATFPPFGSNKGQLIRGAKLKDLKWYAGVVRESLEDPEKDRFADKNRETLKALLAEISRQSGAGEYGHGDQEQDVAF